MRSSCEPWRALLARHGPALVVFARQWAPTHADAEDALQDGFVRFLQARRRPEDEMAYLYACVRSAAIDAARTRDRRRRVDERQAAPEPVFADIPAQMELAASVEAALARLPGEQREVMVMKIWGELTFSQIAVALNTNANTVASRYRYAIERLEAMMTGRMSAGDLREYAAELSAMGDLEGAVPAIDCGERYIVLDTTQRMAHLPPTQAGRLFRSVSNSGAVPPPEIFPFLPIPYEQSMIDANAWYDGLLAALRQPTYAQRHEAIERWNQGVFQVSRGSFLSSPDSILHMCFPDWALRLFMPSLSRFQTRWETDRAQLRLTQVALLLAAWKLDHHEYPASLDDLAADAKKPLPLDNFTDRPLIYARSSTGFTLHSPGPDMIDNGGKGDDIAVESK